MPSAIDAGDQFVWNDHGTTRRLNVTRVLDRSARRIGSFQLHDQISLKKANATMVVGKVVESLTDDASDHVDARYWAYVQAIGGGESFRGLQTIGTTTHMVVVRHPDRPTEAIVCDCIELTGGYGNDA